MSAVRADALTVVLTSWVVISTVATVATAITAASVVAL